ncbi:ATP-binding cassette domain-containing protein [Tropicimonas sp. IMCC34011]|uniref:ATP-binding cassette domain-containing protein n=1 Tax=Tropicimonas sp. IMCC34011 TaxID=2248759 RepID=UPI000E25DA9E|nr:ATP-binding cassette domain-containing protein [Tropicimonas sp. IMCC34011]
MTSDFLMTAEGITKTYGRVVAMDGVDFDLRRGEVLAVIGDNGAGKSTLIKALSGAIVPDSGRITLDGKPIRLPNTQAARALGIETVYQDLALSPSLSITENIFMGRELRRRGPLGSVLRMLDQERMDEAARRELRELGLLTIQDIRQPVETLSGGQRQGVAVARAAAFGSSVIILDEPTAALGVKESRQVLQIIKDIRDRGISIILISHSMPHVFEVADRIHVHRLGRRLCVLDPGDCTPSDAVAYMTGAKSWENT